MYDAGDVMHMLNKFKEMDEHGSGHRGGHDHKHDDLHRTLGVNASTVIFAWIFLLLISSAFLLPVLIATFLLAKSIRRRLPTLINICILTLDLVHIGSYLPLTVRYARPLLSIDS
jgi:hypothetical protein